MLAIKIIQKRFLTLIEIMIVIFLIMIITGALAYNLKGSLDEGKVFKTETGMRRVADQLELAVAKNPNLLEDIPSNWQQIIERSPMVQNANQLIHDGWGEPYSVEVIDGRIEVTSRNLDEYQKRHGSRSNR